MTKKSVVERALERQRMSELKDGKEYPDPLPLEKPSRLRLPSQVERMRAIVRREMSMAAASQSLETFEEADDFELEDVEWTSPYEEVFEPALPSSGAGQAPGEVKPTAPTAAVAPSDPAAVSSGK